MLLQLCLVTIMTSAHVERPLPPSTSSHQAGTTSELIRLKFASAEAEATKINKLLANSDSGMSHTDVRLSNCSTVNDAAAAADADCKFHAVSPVLADIPDADTDTSQGSLVSRLCRLEAALSSFRTTLARISRERDQLRWEKLSVDERFNRATDPFKTELMRIRKASQRECRKAAEAKDKAEDTVKQVQNDLLQSSNSVVCFAFFNLYDHQLILS